MLRVGKKTATVLLVAVGIALAVVYGKVNPDSSYLFPKCPFKQLTGLECPGCGSQRAMHYLLNFEIGSAFRVNALLVFFVPYVLFLVAIELLKSKSRLFLRLHRIFYGTKAILAVLFVIILWWLARNLV